LVPTAAWNTYTRATSKGSPHPGTKGGAKYNNRDSALPTRTAAGSKISYTEWDTEPKMPRVPRTSNRVLIGRNEAGEVVEAWYTSDHYTTFARMESGGGTVFIASPGSITAAEAQGSAMLLAELQAEEQIRIQEAEEEAWAWAMAMREEE
jgi:hypothetical protein